MENLHLYMLLLGCKPEGRHTEQHDILFTIGSSLKELIPDIENFWPEATGKIHIDAWREINVVDDFHISVIAKTKPAVEQASRKLFFLNLGGYRGGEFEEYHYKILSVSENKSTAIKYAKDSLFYQETISSHIDDKYGVDVDDIYDVEDILPQHLKEKYSLQITPRWKEDNADEMNIGYYKLSALA